MDELNALEEKKEEDVVVDSSWSKPPSSPERPPSPPTPRSLANTDIGLVTSTSNIDETKTSNDSNAATTPLTPFWTEATHSAGYRQLMQQWAQNNDDFRLDDYCALPTICVMGDTSSGKSTVLSQLTGIALPAHCQLTTKCPTLLQMMPSDDDDDDGGSITQATVSIQWHATTVRDNLPVFPPQTVTDWSALPSVILQAQTFLLETTHQPVTPDRVVVTMTGPACPNLTLIDLPGVVHQATATESPALPTAIDGILDEYWQNAQALFLVVLPANVDVHNAALLARAIRHGAADRTIPVWTKPDLIDAGAEQAVVDLLTGRTQLLSESEKTRQETDNDSNTNAKLTFHIVKGRGQAALDRQDSLQEALADEEDFFGRTEPWKSVVDRSLLGTAQLRTKLAHRQFVQVQKAVGPALQRLRAEHDTVATQLQNLGAPVVTPLDRRRLYREVCQTFATQLQSTLSGKGRTTNPSTNVGTTGLSAAAALHEACREFMTKIRQGSLATIQDVVEGAHVLVTSRDGTVRGEVVHLDASDFCCVDYIDPLDVDSLALFEQTRQTSLESMEENDVWSDGDKIYIARSAHEYDTLRKIPLRSVRTDPTWLKDRMAQHRTDDLACFLNVDVFQNIVRDFIEADWRPHCVTFLEKLGDILSRAVQEAWQVTLSHCSIRRYPSLQSYFMQECNRVQNEMMHHARQQMEAHLKVERHPYTQDDLLFRNLAAARQRSLRQELHVALGLENEKAGGGIGSKNDNGKALSTAAIAEILDDVFARHEQQSVEDHLAAEMEMVLASYGQIASRRVIDRTPMIGWEVFRNIADSLQESLWSVTDDQLADCFRDEAALVQQYEALKSKQEGLSKAISIFQTVPLVPTPLQPSLS